MPIAFTSVGTIVGGNTPISELKNPTSLQFGPDGRLYVSEQNGTINAFSVELQNGQWVKTGQENIKDANGNEIIKNLQNHNDDGTDATNNNRQVTGIVVTGTEDEPVLYISSSDPRISTEMDTGLDTNSGVVTKASFNSTTQEWEVVDLVRGLPRSEENHAVNGMLLSEDGTKLLLQVGSNTNNGAPSNFFSNTAEYALSAVVLELDLTALEALPGFVDPNGGKNGTPRTVKYDMPTLDDPNVENVTDGVGEDEFGMDEDGPWGGNDGLNMAILPADAPLRIYADGTRNAYDLARTTDGKVYTVDNGGNGGLGGVPNTEMTDDDGDGIANEALSTPNEGGSGEGEPLFEVVEGGYYFFPNPVRSNQNQSWTVYDDDGNPDTSLTVNTVSDISARVPTGVNIASGYLIDPSKYAVGGGQTLADLTPSEQNAFLLSRGQGLNRNDPAAGAMTILGSSTNGIVAYDSGGTAFNGVLDGSLFVAQFSGNLTLLKLNADGTALEAVPTEGADGIFGTADDGIETGGEDGVLEVANAGTGTALSLPLDVTVGPDGTLWVAELGNNQITVLAPTVVNQPIDTDSDDDGIENVDDPFQRDAANGTSVVIAPGDSAIWDFDDDLDGNLQGPNGFATGLTGVAIDGVTDMEQFLQSPSTRVGQVTQLDNMKFATAAGGGTTVVEFASQGTADGSANSGQFLFHTGVSFAPEVNEVSFEWTMINPANPDVETPLMGASQQIGGYIGTGDQSNFLKVVAVELGGSTSGFQILLEDGDTTIFNETLTDTQVDVFDNSQIPSAATISIVLNVDVPNATAVPVVTYETTAGDRMLTGSSIDLTGTNVLSVLQGNYQVQGQASGVAVGLYSSNEGQAEADAFAAVFGDITVSANTVPVAVTAVDDSATTLAGQTLVIPVADLLANDLPDDGSVFVSGVSNAMDGMVSLDDGGTAGDTSDDTIVFTPDNGFIGSASFEYTISDGVDSDTGMVDVAVSPTSSEVLYRVNAGGPLIATIDAGPDWSADTKEVNSPFLVSAGSNSVQGYALPFATTVLPPDVPRQLFLKERFDQPSAPTMQWAFDVDQQPQFYEVKLYLRNGFDGTDQPGERVFDVSVEGSVPASFDDLDPTALFGHKVGGVVSTIVEVTDGTLDLEFLHGVQNPIVNAIEVSALTAATAPISVSIVSGAEMSVGEEEGSVLVSILADETVPSDETVTIDFEIVPDTATPGPGNDYEYTGTSTFSGGVYTGSVSIAGSSSDVQIPISILQDMDIEPGETFTVRLLSTSSNAQLGAVTETIVTINDDDTPYSPPDDSLFGVDLEISDDRLAPTDAGLLALGDNVVTATQEGEVDGENGVRDRDYFTFEIPEGHELTNIFLDDFVNNNPIAPSGFLAIQQGDQLTVDPITGMPDSGTDPLLGAVIFGTGDVTVDLLDRMAQGGVVDITTGFELPAFSTPLTGDITVWLNQGAGPGTPTLRFVTQEVPVGEAELSVNLDQNNIESSNFNTGSFQVTNTGNKAITAIEIDVTDALFPDTVFDPFGLAGDTIAKILTIDSEGNTGVVTPSGGFGDPSTVGVTYFGAGGISGFERIRLEFTDFDPGETVTWSIDMDPNSVAGAGKVILDSGAVIDDKPGDDTWDVGGVGGAELSYSLFSVTFDDDSTADGRLIGQGTGNQIGARTVATQSGNAMAVTLTVNGLGEGSEGTYEAGGPSVTVQGPAGETARVLLAKGFIVPFENNFPDTADPNEYHDQLDAQLAALAASGFPANNAAELQYVDIALDGTVQDISSLFDFTDVDAFTIPEQYYDEAELPLGFTASVIDLATDLPKGPVTDPIHLIFDDPVVGSPPTISPIADVTVDETETVNVAVTAMDPDGNETVSLSVEVRDPNGALVSESDYSFTDNGDGTGNFNWTTPDVDADGAYNVIVSADDGEFAPVEENFIVNITNDFGDTFQANSNGDFVIDVNEMDGGNTNGWTLRNDISGATGGQALSWDGIESFGNPSNGQLSYTFTVEESGVYYYGLRSLSEKGPKSEHNDAFLRIAGTDDNELIPRDGFRKGQIWEPSFTGNSGNFNDGWYKAYQFGGAVNQWAYSNKNVDTVGIPLAYDLVAGQTYVAQVAARSNEYVIDQLQIVKIDNPPDITQGEVTLPVELPASSELSERGDGGGSGNGQPPTISPLADVMVFETETVDLDISATDPDGNNTINLSIDLLRPNGLPVNPNNYTFTDNGDGTADFTWTTPNRNFDGTYDAFIFADDGDNPTVMESFEITVKDGTPPVGSGDILFRVNAGGDLVLSEDSGPDWTADTAANNSPFLIDPGSNTVATPNVPGSAILPSDAPSEVFESHRWDRPNGTTMEYGFDVPESGDYLVRLFMRNTWNGANDPGERLFDVALEGSVPSAFNDIDPTGLFGHKVGGVVEASVAVTDGTLNVEFINNVSNPIVNAIEIVALDDPLAIV